MRPAPARANQEVLPIVPSSWSKSEPYSPNPGAATVRVLVVDDSAFMRKVVSSILASAPGIEVVATARDGEDALAKVPELQPDVITLDLEMPRMDGMAFLEALMRLRPTPVVMVSSQTSEGADKTIACLQRGAVDFVCKPSGAISLNMETVGEELIAKTRAAAKAHLCGLAGLVGRSASPPSAKTLPTAPSSASWFRPQDSLLGPGNAAAAPGSRACSPRHEHELNADTVVVAIASSTGGPAALEAILPHLPADLNAAYLMVQHLPANFTRSLAARLDSACALTVREAQAGERPERGVVLLAPGGRHLELDAQGRVALNDDPPLWGVRPAADVMMRSAAARFGPRVLGVVLTGMGCDGALGVKAIHAAGGLCLAQDEATSIIYGMPRAAYETGALAQVVPLPDMAAAIVRQITSWPRRDKGALNL